MARAEERDVGMWSEWLLSLEEGAGRVKPVMLLRLGEHEGIDEADSNRGCERAHARRSALPLPPIRDREGAPMPEGPGTYDGLNPPPVVLSRSSYRCAS
jgi:hypothetical protein